MESKDNVNYIVEKSLDTYEEKIIYKSKNYDESVKLFGIDIIHNYDNVITKTDNYLQVGCKNYTLIDWVKMLKEDKCLFKNEVRVDYQQLRAIVEILVNE